MTLRIAELVDYSTFPSAGARAELMMDLTSLRITGARVPLEWVARAWFQPRGGNPVARGRGVDLRALENATYGPGELERWRQALVAEAKAVEYVAACAVGVTARGRVIDVQGRVTLIDGRTYPLGVKLADAGKAIAVNFGAPSQEAA